MIKKAAIYDVLFIVLVAVICQILFSKYGFNPTDEGFVLSATNRVLHGQIPHVDFSSVRPLAYAYLHIPELLFSKNYVFLISRFVFFLEETLIAFLWIRLIINFTKTEILNLHKYAIITICFILNVHYFPCSVIHTIDGLLMYLIGLNILVSEKKYAVAGFFFIGFAALCKQNFLVLLPFSLFLFDRKNFIKNTISGILPIMLYVCIISAFGGFQNLKTQLFIHNELFSVGIKTYLKSHMFYAGILLAFTLVFIQNNSFKVFLIFILNAVCIYALATERYHEKFGFLIFGATLSFTLIPIINKHSSFTKLFLTTIILAWCVSISVGYNSPALFLGGCISLIILYVKNISYKFDERLTLYLTIILIPLMSVFYYVRTHLIYRDGAAASLTYKLDEIVEGAYGIQTNLNTFKVLVELDLLKKKYPDLTVLPDFTACNILHSHQSKIATQWPNKTEVPNKEILNFVLKNFINDTSLIAIPKYNLALLSSGFEKVPQNKVDDFLILNYAFTHYKKVETYSYFDIYRK